MNETTVDEKPKTFESSLDKFRAQVTDEDELEMATAAAAEAPGSDDEAPKGEQAPPTRAGAPTGSQGQEMDWAIIPDELKFPRNRQVFFLRFRAGWTDTPEVGDRQCIVWNLSESDEKFAIKRAQGDRNRIAIEMTKQMIRSVDGQVVDWTHGALSNVEKFWRDIGSKCRNMLIGIYHKNHTLNPEEMADFFLHCFASRTAKGG